MNQRENALIGLEKRRGKREASTMRKKIWATKRTSGEGKSALR